MNKVRMNKVELSKKLNENRAQHRKIFEEATEGFRDAVIRFLDEQIANARARRNVKMFIDLKQPVDQTKDYDRAIAMCEVSVDDIIELSEQHFANYMLDDWSWSREFQMTNSQYSETARSLGS